MNNLFSLAKSGLSVAQSALSVVGSNLTNGMSDTYSRRSLVIGELGGMTTGNGFYGYGATVTGVDRAYDAFANKQLRGSVSNWASLNGRMEQLSDIDNMLGDESDNVSVSINNLFKSMATLSATPDDGPARSAVFSSLGVLTQRFNDSGKRLTALEKSTNTNIETSVKEINSISDQLAEVNKQLERVQAQNGTPPADLLDQRDALLEKLSEQIGIDVTENSVSGRVDVTLQDGRPLVFGENASKLQATASESDPDRIVVSYVDSNGTTTPVNEASITKGRLAGLFKFRSEDLEIAKNELNQIAFMMASRMNEQHRLGETPAGVPGGDLFSLPPMKAVANAGNAGGGTLDAISVTDYTNVKSENYSIDFDGTNWNVMGEDGRLVKQVPAGSATLEFDGIEIDLSGVTASTGDSFSFNPMAGAAEGIGRAINSAQDFAAADASGGGVGNNLNLEEMLKIQNEKLIGGSTLTEAYSSLVETIGSNARAVKSGISSAEIDLQTKYDAKQALSGVDMNEETVNMQMFIQYYQANAQILQTATTMFDSLLSIK
ncbi:flagellar hook-associated protein FlgK [Enterobacter hormaechei]|uniref:flagellar hook-associated protein FlgK n=1 Tax=Enterobacter hormaechei TaxID=158836 RepID=UPI0012592E18|nr:flagellar hook-associated protein FlgK [Enterobacter hormaechei]VAK72644.1 flagellar hook-associated protein 1 [Enterobacter hormaechei]